jgi:hypothetical protein
VSSGFFPPLTPRPAVAGLYAPADQARRLPSIFGGVGVGWLGSLAGFLADLGRIPVPYTLEIRQGETLVGAVALPLPPSQVSYARPGATDLAYTFGELPYREPSLYRRLDVSLSGPSGLVQRAGNNRWGEIVWAAGPELVRELDAFLDLYQRTASRAAQEHLEQPDGPPVPAVGVEADPHAAAHGSGDVALVFRSLRDHVHVRCEVKSWRVSSDASRSRLTSDWSLELHAYAPAAPVVPRNFLGYIADAALYVATLIGGVNNTLAATDTILGNVRGDLEVLRAPALALQQTARLFDQVGARGGDLAAFPRTLVADWVAVAGEFGTAWQTWLASGSALSGLFDPATLGLERTAQQAARSQLLARPALGALGGGAGAIEQAVVRRERGVGQDLGPAPVPQGAQERGPAPRPYRLGPGDSLTVVARRFGVDVGELVRLNAIRGGSLGSGQPLGPGVEILIPGTATSAAGPGQGGYGVDLVLDLGTGDLVLEDTGRGASLRLVSGPDLVEQALSVRYLTRQGESRAFPGYGLPGLVGEPSSALVAGLLAVHAQEQAQRDPRVGEVRRCEVEDGGNTFSVLMEIAARDGAELAFTAPLPMALEG